VREIDGKILFMRRLEPGHSAHSFGIQVAQMAGMPPAVVRRARELLAQFEQDRSLIQQPGLEAAAQVSQSATRLQLRLFEQPDAASLRIRELLADVDPERLTPVEALLKLVELKRIVQD
jgi:DNA mismatch repair protein MutS